MCRYWHWASKDNAIVTQQLAQLPQDKKNELFWVSGHVGKITWWKTEKRAVLGEIQSKWGLDYGEHYRKYYSLYVYIYLGQFPPSRCTGSKIVVPQAPMSLSRQFQDLHHKWPCVFGTVRSEVRKVPAGGREEWGTARTENETFS